MKRNLFSDKQNMVVTKGEEAGVKVGELRRRHGISTVTIYLWRKKFGA